jgi:hypothetical protein
MKNISIFILLFLAGCAATKSFVPTPSDLSSMQQKVPDISLEKANAGYALYKSKCASCHRLYAPSEYTISKWEKTLIKMYPRAKVTSEEQKKLIRDYLVALSK